MTKIKLCGITRMCDVETINQLKPEFVGFVFVSKSRRYITPGDAARLKAALSEDIQTVGVFVNEPVEQVAKLLNENLINMAQLHGNEDESYIRRLRELSDRPVMKAFRIDSTSEMREIEQCAVDYVLLDSGAGSGQVFQWNLVKNLNRPYFLAGGLDTENVAKAVQDMHPFAVDVSSGIETGGVKDKIKMAAFVEAVRKGEHL